MWTTCFVCDDAAEAVRRCSRENRAAPAAAVRQTPAARRAAPPRETHLRRRRNRLPNFASQMRVAFSSMAWNTGSSSPGELRDDLQHLRGRRLLLQRLGQIAVRACTSSNSRTFSIAITAWSAKVVDQLDLLVGERLDGSSGQRSTHRLAFPRAASARRGGCASRRCSRSRRSYEFRIGLACRGRERPCASSMTRPTTDPRSGVNGLMLPVLHSSSDEKP